MVEAPRTEVLPRILSGDYDDQFSEVAFVAGGKLYQLARDRLGSLVDVMVKETPFGCSSPILFMESEGHRFFVLPRHGEKEYRVSAPFVNYRANVWALKELGVRRIVAWSGPGALSPRFQIGQFVLPADLIDLTRHRPTTFFENLGIGLLRQRPAFCPSLQRPLRRVLEVLREDNRAIVRTASAASKAADYLLAFRPDADELVEVVNTPDRLHASETQAISAG